jgi:alpha-D-ribose 1-methylphosphonate 5-triphosphate synthase subunit PhnG
MYPNFEEILEELSYRVGIVDLTNESHKQILVKLLRERGIDSAQQLTDRASVVFEYIKEVTKKDPTLSAMPKDGDKLVYFGSKEAKAAALKAGTHTEPVSPKAATPQTTPKADIGVSSAEKNAEPTPTQSEPTTKTVTKAPKELDDKQEKVRQNLNNGDLSELIKTSDEVNDLRDRGIAGAGGSVASYGEMALTRAANDLKGDGYSKFKETNKEAIEVEKKNILANSKANAKKVKEISKQLGYKLPEDEQKVIEYIAERKVYGDLELERLKSNPNSLWYNKGTKGFNQPDEAKKEIAFRNWADAEFDGALATLYEIENSSNIDTSQPYHIIQSNPKEGGADTAIYTHLQDKLEEAKKSGNADDIKHYEQEIRAFEKLGFHDTMAIGKDKNGRTTILHITNKKANDLKDMWANTTPEYMLASIIKQFGPEVSEAVVTFAKDGIERCKDGKQATNRTFASMKIDENFVKISETEEMKPYMDALKEHAEFNKWIQANNVKPKNNMELLQAAQQYMKSAEANGKTVAYKVFGKVLTKVGEFAQVTKIKQKYTDIDFNSESVSLAVKNKNDEKDLVAAVHTDMVNEISKADKEKGFPDKDGNNGPHTEAYITTVFHSMHFDLMVENFDNSLAAVTGIRGSRPADFRGCLAELSGFKGDIESTEGRAKLNQHLSKKCKINATTGFIEITSPNGTVSLAEDSWRTSGESKKVEKKLGDGLSQCVASKVDSRKSNK